MEMLQGERNLHNPSSANPLPDLEAGELTLANRGENQAGPKKSHALKLHGKYPKPILSSIVQFTVNSQGVNTPGKAHIISGLPFSGSLLCPHGNPPRESHRKGEYPTF
jgi:hypothetical protein